MPCRSRYFPYQRGSVSMEWLLLTMAVLLALFAPLPGGDGRSVMAMFMDALKGFYMHVSYLLSLP